MVGEAYFLLLDFSLSQNLLWPIEVSGQDINKVLKHACMVDLALLHFFHYLAKDILQLTRWSKAEDRHAEQTWNKPTAWNEAQLSRAKVSQTWTHLEISVYCWMPLWLLVSCSSRLIQGRCPRTSCTKLAYLSFWWWEQCLVCFASSGNIIFCCLFESTDAKVNLKK